MTVTVLDKLANEGGFTLDLNKGDYVTEGFAVSINPEHTRVIDGEVDSVSVVQYVTDKMDVLGQEGKVFGGWLDTESGKTYLDVVTVFDSKELALDLAVEHGELAIYDITNGQEIRTGLVK